MKIYKRTSQKSWKPKKKKKTLDKVDAINSRPNQSKSFSEPEYYNEGLTQNVPPKEMKIY